MKTFSKSGIITVAYENFVNITLVECFQKVDPLHKNYFSRRLPYLCFYLKLIYFADPKITPWASRGPRTPVWETLPQSNPPLLSNFVYINIIYTIFATILILQLTDRNNWPMPLSWKLPTGNCWCIPFFYHKEFSTTYFFMQHMHVLLLL